MFQRVIARARSKAVGGPQGEPYGERQRRLHFQDEQANIGLLVCGDERRRQRGDHHAGWIFDREVAPGKKRALRSGDPHRIGRIPRSCAAGSADEIGAIGAAERCFGVGEILLDIEAAAQHRHPAVKRCLPGLQRLPVDRFRIARPTPGDERRTEDVQRAEDDEESDEP